jgi:hypothetical protein
MVWGDQNSDRKIHLSGLTNQKTKSKVATMLKSVGEIPGRRVTEQLQVLWAHSVTAWQTLLAHMCRVDSKQFAAKNSTTEQIFELLPTSGNLSLKFESTKLIDFKNNGTSPLQRTRTESRLSRI